MGFPRGQMRYIAAYRSCFNKAYFCHMQHDLQWKIVHLGHFHIQKIVFLWEKKKRKTLKLETQDMPVLFLPLPLLCSENRQGIPNDSVCSLGEFLIPIIMVSKLFEKSE